jgi:hypothetical protein
LARRLAVPGVYLLAFCLTAAPWTIRNYVHWGRFIPFSTKTGPNSYQYNHTNHKVEFGPGIMSGQMPVDYYGPENQSLPDEVSRNDNFARLFREFLWNEPGKFLGLTFVRFWLALLPVAITAASPLATAAAWYIKGIPLLLVLPALFLARPRLWLRVWPLVLYVAYWQALQSVSATGMRYRLPADPAWAVLVGIAFAVVLAALLPGRATAAARYWTRRARRPILQPVEVS